jgi:hypothetical protein
MFYRNFTRQRSRWQGPEVVAEVVYSEQVDQQQTGEDAGSFNLGDVGDTEYREGQSFQLSGAYSVTAIEVKHGTDTGSPTGNWTIRIETDSAGVPSGTLADVNASVVVVPPAANTIIKGTFATAIPLSGATTYWIVVNCDNQTTNTRFGILGNTGGYACGREAVKADDTWTAISTYDFYFKFYALTTL